MEQSGTGIRYVSRGGRYRRKEREASTSYYSPSYLYFLETTHPPGRKRRGWRTSGILVDELHRDNVVLTGNGQGECRKHGSGRSSLAT